MVQLTSKITCQRKHKYFSKAAAENARKRRNNNNTQQFYFPASYKCNMGEHWHLTTQEQEKK